ncbi:MAG TPA: 50S ribosomal protein L21 [Gaiellaceae bacterium]|nr:50S ribosomal protein L21 [Gaiellaceae bacterium]
MTYAVISIGNQQYRVREGQHLLVDRLAVDEGKTFHPDLIMVGGNGDPKLGSDLKGEQVTAKVAEHVLGKKIVIGKHRRRTGYKRRRGFRAHLTRIEIQAIGGASSSRSTTTAKKESATAEQKPAAKRTTAARKTSTAKKPAAAAKKPARKSAPRKKKSEE